MRYKLVEKISGRAHISRDLRALPLHELDEWELTTDKTRGDFA